MSNDMDLHATLNEVRHPPADTGVRIGLLAGVVVFGVGLAACAPLILVSGNVPLLAALLLVACFSGWAVSRHIAAKRQSDKEADAQALRDAQQADRDRQLSAFVAARKAEKDIT